MELAATKIQATYRGKKARAEVQEEKQEMELAATKIQATYRGNKARQATYHDSETQVTPPPVTKSPPRTPPKKHHQTDAATSPLPLPTSPPRSPVVLDAVLKKRQHKATYAELGNARLILEHELAAEAAAFAAQRAAFRAQREAERQARERAALRIQARTRGRLARKSVAQRLSMLSVVQTAVQGYLARILRDRKQEDAFAQSVGFASMNALRLASSVKGGGGEGERGGGERGGGGGGGGGGSLDRSGTVFAAAEGPIEELEEEKEDLPEWVVSPPVRPVPRRAGSGSYADIATENHVASLRERAQREGLVFARIPGRPGSVSSATATATATQEDHLRGSPGKSPSHRPGKQGGRESMVRRGIGSALPRSTLTGAAWSPGGVPRARARTQPSTSTSTSTKNNGTRVGTGTGAKEDRSRDLESGGMGRVFDLRALARTGTHVYWWDGTEIVVPEGGRLDLFSFSPPVDERWGVDTDDEEEVPLPVPNPLMRAMMLTESGAGGNQSGKEKEYEKGNGGHGSTGRADRPPPPRRPIRAPRGLAQPK